MKVLVVYGSKHGSTRGISEKIAEILKTQKLKVELTSTDNGPDVTNFDAVIIGSGVYAGNWLAKAKKFIEFNSADLLKTKVWLFSTGPIGEPLKPEADKAISPAVLEDIKTKSGAVEHKLFAGSLDMKSLNFGEKLVVKAFKTPEGDFRDWDEISNWAKKIAKQLKS